MGMAVIAVVVSILIVVLLAQSHNLKKKISSYKETNQQLAQSIDEEMGRAEEMERLPEYVQSDEFVEKTAREKFGLAYDNEVIFRPEEP